VTEKSQGNVSSFLYACTHTHREKPAVVYSFMKFTAFCGTGKFIAIKWGILVTAGKAL
jgi:hypothetical protein